MNPNSTIILANGDFPTSSALLELLDHSTQIICCDGAVNKLLKSGREPQLIIGDLDSIEASIQKQYQDRIIHIADQNSNDLTKAVHWCVEQGLKSVILLGATGEREDHTIANVALLAKYHNQIQIKMLSDKGLFMPISETTTIDTFEGQQVSIFSLDPEIPISSEGLKYPLKELKLKSWWMGTLNESVNKTFTLKFDKGARLIVYLAKQ